MDDHDFGRTPVSRRTIAPPPRKTGVLSLGRIAGLAILLLAGGVVLWIVRELKEGPASNARSFLAKIDPPPLQVAHDQAERTLANEKALLANETTDLARYQ